MAARRLVDGAFPRVAGRWLATRKSEWSDSTYRKARYVLATYLIPGLRRRSVDWRALHASEGAVAAIVCNTSGACLDVSVSGAGLACRACCLTTVGAWQESWPISEAVELLMAGALWSARFGGTRRPIEKDEIAERFR